MFDVRDKKLIGRSVIGCGKVNRIFCENGALFLEKSDYEWDEVESSEISREQAMTLLGSSHWKADSTLIKEMVNGQDICMVAE